MPARRCIAMAAACFGLACGGDEADATYVRLHNVTEFNFDSLSFFTVSDPFGPLPAGAFSGFVRTEGVYPLEGGYAEGDGHRFFGMVTDHVGDEFVGNGYHTYAVLAGLGHAVGENDGTVFFQQE